jgi:hypothetical protein
MAAEVVIAGAALSCGATLYHGLGKVIQMHLSTSARWRYVGSIIDLQSPGPFPRYSCGLLGTARDLEDRLKRHLQEHSVR